MVAMSPHDRLMAVCLPPRDLGEASEHLVAGGEIQFYAQVRGSWRRSLSGHYADGGFRRGTEYQLTAMSGTAKLDIKANVSQLRVLDTYRSMCHGPYGSDEKINSWSNAKSIFIDPIPAQGPPTKASGTGLKPSHNGFDATTLPWILCGENRARPSSIFSVARPRCPWLGSMACWRALTVIEAERSTAAVTRHSGLGLVIGVVSPCTSVAGYNHAVRPRILGKIQGDASWRQVQVGWLHGIVG
nr:hypothetical protein CFP56_70230 [Quercus suber]